MENVESRILKTLRREDVFLLALATVDEAGQPHVRYLRGRVSDDLTIRCPTFLGTAKVGQITREPRVALTCGETSPERPGTYFEIEGIARISTDAVDRGAVWNERLAKWFSGSIDPEFGVVVIRPTRIEALPIGGGEPAQAWRRDEAGA